MIRARFAASRRQHFRIARVLPAHQEVLRIVHEQKAFLGHDSDPLPRNRRIPNSRIGFSSMLISPESYS